MNATGGDAAEGAGELDRSGGDGALADADGDDLAGVPLLMLRLQLPCGRGHGAGDFVGKVDAGLLTEAKGGGVFGDGIDAEAVGEGVVEGVAGVGDGVVDVDGAVMAVAGVEVAVETGSAIAADVHGLGDVLLEAGDRHDDLEGAAGRELGLDGLVEERMVGVIEDLVPVVLGEADGELIGVEGGARGHGEDLAGVGIHGDDGSDLAFEGLFCGHLDVEVDGELQVFAGNGLFLEPRWPSSLPWLLTMMSRLPSVPRRRAS